MSVLQLSQVRLNMRAVVQYAGSLGGSLPDTRTGYFAALNRLQKHQLSFEPYHDSPQLAFDLENGEVKSIIDTLVMSEEFEGAREVVAVPSSQRQPITQAFDVAMSFFDWQWPEAGQIIRSLVAMVIVLRKPGYVGGSFWHLLGGVWFSPAEQWTRLNYSANLLHESVHQAMFLDDMVNRLFTAEPRRMFADDALVTSSIRRVRRPLHYAYHAATVSTVLIEFYRRVNEPSAVRELANALPVTLAELDERRNFLTPRGCALLDQMIESLEI